MINEYVNKLIENLPENVTKNKSKIDLVLDGGMFNGSYLVGSLYFIKEMERRKYIEVDRISGCSVGSIVALLYFINSLDLMAELYDVINKDFKTNYCLNSVKNIKTYLKDKMPNDICDKINGKLFICYNDVKNNKKIIKSQYKNVDEIFDTIIKSCYIPFLIDNNMLYKNKYIDGMNAYIFDEEKDKKILHMELLNFDKFTYAFDIKNEKTNFHRILSGLLEIHCFFIKGTNTSMFSYVNDWNIINRFKHNCKLILERIIKYLLYLVIYLKQYVNNDIYDNIFYKLASKIIYDLFCLILETYFL